MGHYLTLIFSPRITRIYTDLLDIQIDKYERYAEASFPPHHLIHDTRIRLYDLHHFGAYFLL